MAFLDVTVIYADAVQPWAFKVVARLRGGHSPEGFLIRASLLQVVTHTCFLRSWVPDGTPNFFFSAWFFCFSRLLSYTGYKKVLFHVFHIYGPGARCIRNSKSILDLL